MRLMFIAIIKVFLAVAALKPPGQEIASTCDFGTRS